MYSPAFYNLGFDVSTTGAAAVLLADDDDIVDAWGWQAPAALEGPENVSLRVFDIGEWADRVFRELKHEHGLLDASLLSCSIERPFFKGASSADLAEAQGAVKSACRTQWGRYPAQTVKATAHALTGITTAGKKGLGKAPMYEAAIDYWSERELGPLGHATHDAEKPAVLMEDMIDALWVAKTDQLAMRATRGD